MTSFLSWGTPKSVVHMDGNLTHDKKNDGEHPLTLWRKFTTMRHSEKKHVRVSGYILYRVWRIASEGLALIMGLAFLWLYGANYLTAHKKVDISFLSPNVSAWFAATFEGRAGEIETIFLEWDAQSNRVVFTANNAVVLDENDSEIQSVKKVTSSLDFTKALSGHFVPEIVEINGGSVTWVKTSNGRVIAGLGTPETVGKFGVFLHSQPGEVAKNQPFSMGDLQGIRTNNSTIYVLDATSQVNFRIHNANLELLASGKDYTFNAAGDIYGQQNAGIFDLRSNFNDDFSDVTFDLNAQGLRLSEIAPKIGRFHELSEFTMPLDSQLSLRAKPGLGLETVRMDLTAGEGEFSLFGVEDKLESASLVANYDTNLRKVIFETVDIQSEKLRAQGQFSFSNVGTPATAFRSPEIEMDMDLTRLYMDLTQYFDAPFDYSRVITKAFWIGEEKRLDVEMFEFSRAKYSLIGDIELRFSDTGKILGLTGQLDKAGVFAVKDFLAYWPKNFVNGARRWIFKAMQAGEFDQLKAKFDVDDTALAGRPLNDNQLKVDFSVINANVQYMDHMPPYLNASASGILQGNHLEVMASGGRAGTLNIHDGIVNIPVLRPKGGDFTINVNGSGDVAEMLRIIDNKPFEYTSRYGVKAEDFGGHGVLNLKVTRPLLEFFELDRVTYEVTGDIKEASAPFALGEHWLKNGDVSLRSDKTGMEVTGPVDFGPWRPILTINEVFTEPRPPTSYNISGIMNREVLDKFGIGFRQYFDGEIDLTIDAEGRGINVGAATIDANLTNSHIQFAQYNKALGEPASLSGVLTRQIETGGTTFEDLSLTGQGLSIIGNLDMGGDGRLNYLSLPSVFIEGVGDVKLDVRPDAELSKLMINLSGKYLDVSDIISQMIRPDAKPLGVPYALKADLEALVIKPDFILTNTLANVDNNGEEILSADVTGQVFGEPFSFLVDPQDGARQLHLEIPDAGKAIYAFSKSTRVSGGQLLVDGELLALGDGGGFVGNVRMDDFVVEEAPAFAQLLSFGSLKGLFDTLSGSGVHFDKLRMPVEYRRGRLKMTEARMSGSALGMTADGIINIANKTMDIDGVLVPSYTANSLLGGVPIIGDILVGKKGEGIFALSYSMKGPFEKTEVTVNPLSALTPGFLRGIFEPNRKKDDEIMEEAAQENAAANEKVEAEETMPDE